MTDIFTQEQNAKLAAKRRAAGGGGALPSVESGEEPNATIFVENLPTEANESMLNLLFSQFPGFKKRTRFTFVQHF